jgi:hypothetical protein
MLISGFYHDPFRLTPPFDVFGLSDPLRRYRLSMVQDLVLHFVCV